MEDGFTQDPEPSHTNAAVPPRPNVIQVPEQIQALIDRIAAAEGRGDWQAVVDAAASLRIEAPDRQEGYRGAASALRRLSRLQEAQDLVSIAHQKFPVSSADLRNKAKLLFQRREFDAALDVWAEFRQLFPDQEAGIVGAIRVARSAGRQELLQQLIDDGRAQFPNGTMLLRTLADIESRNGSVELAGKQWANLTSLASDNPSIALAAALAPLTPTRGPRGRFKAALDQIEAVKERFPDYIEAYIAQLNIHRRCKRLDRAAKLATKACTKFPDSVALSLAHITILEEQGHVGEAKEKVIILRSNNKPDPVIERAYVQSLSRVSQFDAAESVCLKAIASFPENVDLLVEFATIALRRGDWTEALSRFLEAQKLRPASPKIKHGINAVRLQLANLQLPESSSQDGETGRFFSRFESLGGTGGGCEFGMVQRHYGSVSLSLLRWSNIRADHIIQGLNRGFAGLGDIENIELRTLRVAAEREEYLIYDRNYGLGSHTFIDVKSVPPDKMLLQTAKRLAFLRGKLLEELRDARKIFVFKFKDAVNDEFLIELSAAMRRHGNVTLLCALKANDTHKKGTVRQLGNNLFVGYLGHFVSDAAGGARSIDFPTWKAICNVVADRHDPEGHPGSQTAGQVS